MTLKPVELEACGNRPASPAVSQSRRIEPAMALGATVTDVARPASIPWLARNATQVIAREFSAEQPGTEGFKSPNQASAGATQLIEVPHQAIHPNAIVEAAAKNDSPASKVTPPKPIGGVDVAPTESPKPRHSGSPVLMLSPSEAAPSRPTSSQKFEPVPLPAARVVAVAKLAALTTAIDVPVVRPASPQSAAQRAKPANSARSAAPSVEPLHATAQPSAIAKLGILTRRYPVGVIGGAAVGSIVLGVFLVGAAQILGLKSSASVGTSFKASEQVAVVVSKPVAPSVATAIAGAASVRPASEPAAHGAPEVAPSPRVAPATASAAATEADPSLLAAVGHLFSGRLMEGEQAYRELAARHPEEPTYHTVSRILARRNGPDCRPGNPTQKACPTVKQ